MSRCYQRLFQTSDLLVIRATEDIGTQCILPALTNTHARWLQKDTPMSFSIFVFTGDQVDLHNRFTDKTRLCTYPTSGKSLGNDLHC